MDLSSIPVVCSFSSATARIAKHGSANYTGPLSVMRRVWRTISSFIWWSYDRGSIQYDVMVTLILLFIFLAPLKINFKDKPIERIPHPTKVILIPDGDGYVYQVDSAGIAGKGADGVQGYLQRVIEPIAGEVEIARYEPVYDKKGQVVAYKVWLQK
jgi:hypothetical protein